MFQIDLANETDDVALRSLLATNAVPGRVTVSFEREPNYFLGCSTMGEQCQVVVARQGTQIAAVACRTMRPMYVNGQSTDIGYLGQLRVDKRFRGRWLVSRGFHYLRQLHDETPVSAYLLSIIEQNREAFGVLIERRRRHFPDFYALGRLHTLALSLQRTEQATNAEVASASADDLDEIIAFWHRQSSARQFYPVYAPADFTEGITTRGFRLEDLLLARRQGQIIGTIGLWDQSSYKQTVVRGYTDWLRAARPFYNFSAKLLTRPILPPVGAEIRSVYASFICVADDDPAVFQALLRQLYQLAAARGYSYLMIGLHERDPFLSVARRYSHITYHSNLFLAAWEKGFYERLDQRIPYVEIATL